MHLGVAHLAQGIERNLRAPTRAAVQDHRIVLAHLGLAGELVGDAVDDVAEPVGDGRVRPALVGDGDGAGQRAASRAANLALPFLLPGKSLKFVSLPKGKDPDDIAKENPELLKKLLQSARALSEIIYELEKTARPVTTPEQQADLKARLEARSKEIKNSEISHNYGEFFKSQLWNEFKSKKQQNPNNTASSNVTKLAGIRTESQKLDQLLLYLIATLLEAPQLLEDTSIQEELANFEISNVEIDKLRQNILHTSASDAFDFNEVIQALPIKLKPDVEKGMAYARKRSANEAWLSLTESYYLEVRTIEAEKNDDWEIFGLQELEQAKQKINQKNND